ncbi:hypothetical protein GCM10022631_23680 [Deinococcus rubellus]|uniref:hypothetical protein n=1 Tax=Deinococcus rubellus TaxID=1889240 RepID=UPI0031E6C2C5
MNVEVILSADQPQELKMLLAWAWQVGLDADTLSNSSCGCGVHIHGLSMTPQAARRLGERLRAAGSSVNFKT